MNDNTYNNKILSSPAKAQQIIQYCRQKFINILPNNSIRPTTTAKRPHPQSSEPLQISSLNPSLIIYKKQQVKQVMRQLSIFLQLVIQNCLLSSDSKIKAQSYRILGNFRNLLSRDLDEFQTMIYNKNKSKLPFYEVECKEILNRHVEMRIPPQVSLYQDPLLFYIYTRFAQDELFVNHSVHVNREQRIEILKKHVPFLDPLFMPIISERLQTKAKFSQLEDRLLLILVKSKLDISQYRPMYFPLRAQAQIKNRIKNLCGNGKQIGNPIKEIKLNEYIPLTEEEIQKITRGYMRFGARWPVIAKYYQVRSGQFLQAQYTGQDRLKKRRQKQKIKPQYTSLKELIDTKIQQFAKQQRQCQMIQLNQTQQPIIIQGTAQKLQHFSNPTLSYQQSQHIHNIQNQPMDLENTQQIEEPQYKIINHLTFQYQEI